MDSSLYRRIGLGLGFFPALATVFMVLMWAGDQHSVFWTIFWIVPAVLAALLVLYICSWIWPAVLIVLAVWALWIDHKHSVEKAEVRSHMSYGCRDDKNYSENRFLCSDEERQVRQRMANGEYR